jgi:hypothetical protein
MSTLSHTVKLSGRDEHGFVEGSEAQRDFRRVMKAWLLTRSRRRPDEQAEKQRARWRSWLEAPAWVSGAEPEPAKVTRSWYRDRARKAARALGVSVPEWARRRQKERSR